MNYELKDLLLDEITLDSDTQPRVESNHRILAEYTELVRYEEEQFPPVVVFWDGKHYLLADGYHRYAAFEGGWRKTIPCHVYQGSKRDAILYSVGANGRHGLNMTNADKRRAVTKLLEDPEWSQWSDREIARRCHVDHSFVGKLRKSLGLNTSDTERKPTYTNKHGGVSTMNISAIGKVQTKLPTVANDDYPPIAEEEEWELLDIEELKTRLQTAYATICAKEERIAELEEEIAQLKEQLGEGHEESLPF